MSLVPTTDWTHLGTDLLTDDAGDILLDEGGDLAACEPERCILQDVLRRLTTAKGGLWYDSEFYTDLPPYLHRENDAANRAGLAMEIDRSLAQEARLIPEATAVEIESWDLLEILVAVSVWPVGSESPKVLTLKIGEDGIEGIIGDYRPVSDQEEEAF